jgi:hypothetical protein
LAKVASQLIFNMSVTPVRETKSIGKWRASLWPPDAPLCQLSASLRCARVLRPAYRRDRDPLTLCPFRMSWPAGARHKPPLTASYHPPAPRAPALVLDWKADA